MFITNANVVLVHVSCDHSQGEVVDRWGDASCKGCGQVIDLLSPEEFARECERLEALRV